MIFKVSVTSTILKSLLCFTNKFQSQKTAGLRKVKLIWANSGTTFTEMSERNS